MSSYQDWSDYHIKAFGLRFDGDDVMVTTWIEAFVAAGYSPEELFAASKWMLAESAPKRPSDHLLFIQQHIIASRSEANANAVKFARRHEHRTPCRLCDNTGLVIVPHLRFVVGGSWIEPCPTMAVACACMLGEKTLRESVDEDRTMISLNKYELQNDNDAWTGQMAARAEMKRKMARAHAHTKQHDNGFDAVIARIRASSNETSRQRAA